MARTPFKRTDRVSSLVRQVLGELITFEIKDPRVRGAVISDVEITGDLREARVFLIPPENEAEAQALMTGLAAATGFLRREIGQRIRLRVTPQLDFRYDHSIEYGNRIEQRLRELGLGGTPPEPDEQDASGEDADLTPDDTLDESPAPAGSPVDAGDDEDDDPLDDSLPDDSSPGDGPH
jgi:ribosome-binding factor A